MRFSKEPHRFHHQEVRPRGESSKGHGSHVYVLIQQQPKAASSSQDLRSAVWTRQMSSVGAAQMLSVETQQVSAAETRQTGQTTRTAALACPCTLLAKRDVLRRADTLLVDSNIL